MTPRASGEESRPAPLRHRRSRRQPAFGQIRPSQRRRGSRASQTGRKHRLATGADLRSAGSHKTRPARCRPDSLWPGSPPRRRAISGSSVGLIGAPGQTCRGSVLPLGPKVVGLRGPISPSLTRARFRLSLCSRPKAGQARLCGQLAQPYDGRDECDDGEVVAGGFLEAGSDAAELLELREAVNKIALH